ncbi:HAMP domain-containing protein [Clostridium akagii]|uniref:HAMP domain-containing protein n=1 Tax=Clostridium akagii TaxID=91623 RepID=UPI00047B9A7A|nr:HAMP domain-containing protein [Clostridium akagii]
MRMKFSIRYKFTIGFLLIFCLCFTFITIFINNIVIVNNEKVISNELLSSQTDINTYLKQFLMINSIKSNSGEFEKKSSDIGAALSSKLNTRIVLYKKDGSLLLDTDNSNGNMFSDSGKLITDSFMDLKSAVKGQSAYKIVKLDKTYKVIFSEPLYIDKTTLGVLRYTVDYTELFQNGNNLVIKLKVFMLFMFFIFSILLSTKIIIPIIKLNKSAKEISNGNFNIDVFIESNDEIGELGQSFKIMKGKIKEQIETIKKDRDGLIKLGGHRKVFLIMPLAK